MQYQNGQKSKDNVARQYRIANPAATDEDVRRLVESDQGGAFSQQVIRTLVAYRHFLVFSISLVTYNRVILTILLSPSDVG